MDFARAHMDKSISFWNSVLFSNESKFNIFGSDHERVTVWRKPYTQMETKNLYPTVKHGNVLVWECMSAVGVGKLQFIEGTIDQYVYLNILKRFST